MAVMIHTGRMRHVIQFYEQLSDTDDYGEPVAPVPLFDPIMAEVVVRSGSENSTFGIELTDEVLTVLTWYDPRVKNKHLMKWVDTDSMYEVSHVKPDEIRRGMIVTCKVQRDG